MNNGEGLPKPLAALGQRPLLWHLMKYYAHYGHRDFILCLGEQPEKYKEYFLNYDECLSNDFVWSRAGRQPEPLASEISDWRITFVATGGNANTGERLLAVRRFLQDEEHFLANTCDGLTDCPLPHLIRRHVGQHTVATVVSSAREGEADLWMNAGFFVLRGDIFHHLRAGEELVEGPFRRLVAAGQLNVVRHHGFWHPLDTQTDLMSLSEMTGNGPAPWEVWRRAQLTIVPKLGALVTSHATSW